MDTIISSFRKPSEENFQTWIVYSCNFYPQNSFNFIRCYDRLDF